MMLHFEQKHSKLDKAAGQGALCRKTVGEVTWSERAWALCASRSAVHYWSWLFLAVNCELRGRRVRVVSLQPGLLASEEGAVPSVRGCASALAPNGLWWQSWVGRLNAWGQSLVNLLWFQGDNSTIFWEISIACCLLVRSSFSHIQILWEKPHGFSTLPFTSCVLLLVQIVPKGLPGQPLRTVLHSGWSQ